jgi:hypothetical protein
VSSPVRPDRAHTSAADKDLTFSRRQVSLLAPATARHVSPRMPSPLEPLSNAPPAPPSSSQPPSTPATSLYSEPSPQSSDHSPSTGQQADSTPIDSVPSSASEHCARSPPEDEELSFSRRRVRRHSFASAASSSGTGSASDSVPPVVVLQSSARPYTARGSRTNPSFSDANGHGAFSESVAARASLEASAGIAVPTRRNSNSDDHAMMVLGRAARLPPGGLSPGSSTARLSPLRPDHGSGVQSGCSSGTTSGGNSGASSSVGSPRVSMQQPRATLPSALASPTSTSTSSLAPVTNSSCSCPTSKCSSHAHLANTTSPDEPSSAENSSTNGASPQLLASSDVSASPTLSSAAPTPAAACSGPSEPADTSSSPRADSDPRSDVWILLVEDNALNQMLVQRHLTRLGYAAERIHVCENGAQAVQAACLRRYSVILMVGNSEIGVLSFAYAVCCRIARCQ